METYQKQASDIFLKYIYDYCMGVEYNSRQLRILAERFDTSVLQIRDWSLRYAKETFAEEKYKNIVQKIEQFSINNRMLWDVYIENKNPVLYMLTGKVTKYLWENEEEKQLMMKYIYENCVRLEWKSEQLDLLAERIGIEKKELRRLARTYAQKTFTEEEYKNISLHISELTEKDRLNRKLEIMCINPILYQSIGKITNRLWENEDEKKIVLEYIYNYCENNFYYKDKIDEIVEKFGISETRIREYAKEYAIKYLGFSAEEYKQKRTEYGRLKSQMARESRDSYSKNVYDKLLNATLVEEITEIINNCGFNISTLKASIGDYTIVHHGGNNQIYEILKSKIKMYTDYILQQKQKQFIEAKAKEIEEKLPLAIETITKFINDADCYTIDYFCYKYTFDKKTFEEYVTIIREYQTDLYNTYDKKISDIQKQRYAILANQVKYIIDRLKHGIEEYDVNRPFDLVDYYGVTKIPLEDILKLAKNIVSQSELTILRKFVNQNISGSSNNPNVINQIMSERVIIKYEKDKKGQPIPGTEELFGDEEKEKLINYLKERKIPINLKTYNIVYRRYRNGTLELDASLKKK